MPTRNRITPEGLRDLLFEECGARRAAETRLLRLFAARGFAEVMTPGLEFYDVFGALEQSPDDLYKLTDSKGRLLVMRPDTTLPIARLAATRLKDVPRPLRLCYAQDVFRLNRAMTGRSDQEFQAGVELIGASGLCADLDVLTLAAETLTQFAGGRTFRLEIGDIRFFNGLLARLNAGAEQRADIRRLVERRNYAALADALESLPDSPAKEALLRLPRLFGGAEVLDEARALCGDSPDDETIFDGLLTLYNALSALGYGEHVMLDLGMVHESDYYTGIIFRAYMEGSGEAVISGGRYDALLAKFGADAPATGFGVRVDALARLE
ncbi:MAG: ATP phosphoribosyltransferase regulatory subunit, partial [Oscillospiraceae bacterium]|nr:ATP phosphoribosyltransferase regulatory subunit [Oscillospiraceae bacterium]